MLRNRIYYWLKPLLPRVLRLAIRRQIALRILKRVGHIWPILPGSEKPPEGWRGWPEGRKFTVVLSHDVEGQKGVDRVRALAELEMELGFRSSFNFIPEGEYQVPKELRDWLTEHGFEVGVHDLHHDGKLYRSRTDFKKNANQINRYLKEWGAVGFRSGFMLHNLEWIHDLNIKYDASTFDTDPFEPQPDNAGTIFPFWVPFPDGEVSVSTSAAAGDFTGYMELPYTLAQDSTLFLVLKEQGINVWKQKFDWLAEHGGMALLNVHPDYINFEAGRYQNGEFSVAHYRAFLEYVRTFPSGEYWHALPRDIAELCAPLTNCERSTSRKSFSAAPAGAKPR
ncbi:MAG: hypothetical protein JWL59_1846 [Chthoniobacteraceae bacterium]|nr:hypothetical protein [Chthoniobacteraceae bacterium]